jgi:hypothetical protein
MIRAERIKNITGTNQKAPPYIDFGSTNRLKLSFGRFKEIKLMINPERIIASETIRDIKQYYISNLYNYILSIKAHDLHHICHEFGSYRLKFIFSNIIF